MARVIYPFFSLSASGKFGRHLVYRSRKFGQTVVRFQPFKPWKLTAKRKWLLRKFSEVSNQWWLLTPEEKQVYIDRAKWMRDSPYAVYIKEKLSGATPPEE